MLWSPLHGRKWTKVQVQSYWTLWPPFYVSLSSLGIYLLNNKREEHIKHKLGFIERVQTPIPTKSKLGFQHLLFHHFHDKIRLLTTCKYLGKLKERKHCLKLQLEAWNGFVGWHEKMLGKSLRSRGMKDTGFCACLPPCMQRGGFVFFVAMVGSTQTLGLWYLYISDDSSPNNHNRLYN